MLESMEGGPCNSAVPTRKWQCRRVVRGATFAWLFAVASLAASADVCRWVDDAGRVHFADRCPPGVEGESVILEPGPSGERLEQAQRESRALQERVRSPFEAPSAETASADGAETAQAAPAGLRTLSPEDVRCPRSGLYAYVLRMERACEEARERQIAPLRQEQIDRCIAEQGRDRAACEREYADFMNPRYIGRLEARAFDFLPDCIIARTCRERAGMEVDGRRERSGRRPP